MSRTSYELESSYPVPARSYDRSDIQKGVGLGGGKEFKRRGWYTSACLRKEAGVFFLAIYPFQRKNVGEFEVVLLHD